MFWLGNLRERDRLENQQVDGRILNASSRNRLEGMDWIDLAQDTYNCR